MEANEGEKFVAQISSRRFYGDNHQHDVFMRSALIQFTKHNSVLQLVPEARLNNFFDTRLVMQES
jgi:hypothetical protein